jgi:hypothetical protein
VAPVAPETLTESHLNRAVLARQLLLERRRTSLPDALELIGGIQAQYAPAMYIGLWSRLEGFGRDELTTALEQRKVAQGTLQRSTIHLVSAADYWPFALAVREFRRGWWLRVQQHSGHTDEEMTEGAQRLRAHLAQQGSARRRDIAALCGTDTNGVGLWLDMVRVPPSGTWAHRPADLYAAAEDWLGPPPADLDPGAALEHVVRRYLQGFGPATVAEIADWAGVRPKSAVAPALARLPLRRFRAENGEELIDLEGAPLPDPDTPAPVRFLPVWDAILLAHARRAAVIAEEHRPRVFNTRTPHSLNTFLVNGQVAGTWKHAARHIVVEPFGKLDARAAREVDAEAERLAAFHS